ncbi:MAG TPA: Hpt domain-containing protein, partial [Anaeromyxobacteraceae bacterium]|nr:Hpt domain-containing protein [Anaeromyxobacteraceae bacterium]
MGAEEIRQKLLGKFREVTQDRVEKLSASLLALERGGGEEVKAEIARELHTLKGEARMMGFTGLSQVIHAAEDLLKVLPGQKPGDRLDALLQACDAIPGFLSAPPDGGPPAEKWTARLRGLIRAERGDGVAAGGAETEAPRAELRGDQAAQSIRVDVDRLDEIASMAGDLLVDGARSAGRTRDLGTLFTRWSRLADRVVAASEQLRNQGLLKIAEQMEGDVHLLRSDTFRFQRTHAEASSSAQAQFAILSDRIGSARLIPLSGVLA